MVEPEGLTPKPPNIYGPVWRTYEDGTFWLPEKTLGWGILNWLASYVLQPGGPQAGESFMPTLEQARFLLWWYAVDDEGRFVYRSGTLRRMKGWGKDPLVAAMSLAELSGPVQFSHWQDGNPVGKNKHSAWVQIAAVTQDQTSTTFRMFPGMIAPSMREDYGLDVNKTVIYSANGGIIEGVTSSPHAMEGKRPTFVVKNEAQWWLETNDGHSMDEVISGNVDKAAYGACRALSICNAHIPGQDSVAERDYDSYQDVLAGSAVDTGILYDALEAPADTPVSEIPSQAEDPDGHQEGLDRLRSGLLVARGDAVWIPIDTILLSILDTRRPITESRRKWLNQVNASEDSWITPSEWDAVADTSAKLSRGQKITLGFDGSKSDDHTALVACRVEDACIFPIKTWNPADYVNEEIPRDDVDDWVNYCFERYDVVAFRADVREFEAYIDQWAQKYRKRLKIKATPGNYVAFDMRGNNKKFGLDCERFLDAVLEDEVAHNGSTVLRTHVLNARRHPTRFDSISIRKESKDSSKKIDAAVCAVLAFGARQEFLVSKQNRSNKAVMIK